jgi:sarcosine oxidase subunit gamma
MSDGSTVSISAALPRSIAGIGAFRDQSGLRAALQAEFGISLPDVAGFVQAGPVTFSCIGPARYIATAAREAGLPARLAIVLQDLAAVTDQSDLWEIFGVSGGDVREMLARVVPVDLRPEKFAVGGVVLTRAGHIDVRVWRIGDLNYEIAVARSYAADLLHELNVARKN